MTKSTNMNDCVNRGLNIAKHHLFMVKHMWSALTSTCWSLWILFKEFLCWCFESLFRVCQTKISSKRLVDGHLGGLNARVDIFEVGQQREITLHFLVCGEKHSCISCLVV